MYTTVPVDMVITRGPPLQKSCKYKIPESCEDSREISAIAYEIPFLSVGTLVITLMGHFH